MYARTLRKIILGGAALVAVLGLLSGWRFVRGIRRLRDQDVPETTLISSKVTTTTRKVSKSWFAPIRKLGKAPVVEVGPARLPSVVYKGLFPDPDPTLSTAFLEVAGKQVSARVGDLVAGGVVREISDDAVVLEVGNNSYTIKRQVRKSDPLSGGLF